jgi:hypothetical protein
MGLLDMLFRRNKPVQRQQHGGRDMVSLVVLSQSSPDLTLDSMRASLDALFPGQFLPPKEEGNFVIDGPVEGATYMIQCTVPGVSAMYMFHNVPGPYTEFSDFPEHLSGSLRELAVDQACWMSVDLLHSYGSDQDPYRFIGAVLSQFAPPDANVLLHPSKMDAVEFTSEVRQQLASGGQPFGVA